MLFEMESFSGKETKESELLEMQHPFPTSKMILLWRKAIPWTFSFIAK